MDSTQPIPGPDLPLINIRKLQTFVMLGIDDYVEMLGDLMREVPEQLEQIRIAIEQGNLEDCREHAHSMRGILGYFGCVTMTRRLASLESRTSLMPEDAAATCEEFQTLCHLDGYIYNFLQHYPDRQ